MTKHSIETPVTVYNFKGSYSLSVETFGKNKRYKVNNISLTMAEKLATDINDYLNRIKVLPVVQFSIKVCAFDVFVNVYKSGSELSKDSEVFRLSDYQNQTARKEDLKQGVILIDKGGNEHLIAGYFHEGQWETNAGHLIHENSLMYYTIKR